MFCESSLKEQVDSLESLAENWFVHIIPSKYTEQSFQTWKRKFTKFSVQSACFRLAKKEESVSHSGERFRNVTDDRRV